MSASFLPEALARRRPSPKAKRCGSSCSPQPFERPRVQPLWMSEPPLFDAFEAAALLPDEVPGHLESIAVRGEQLVVGTSDGQLLLYQISPAHVSPSATDEPPTCVMSARRSLGCGRNPVSRIELCSATGTGFALCDTTVSLFELHDGIQMSGALPASKGTAALCLDAAC